MLVILKLLFNLNFYYYNIYKMYFFQLVHKLLAALTIHIRIYKTDNLPTPRH